MTSYSYCIQVTCLFSYMMYSILFLKKHSNTTKAYASIYVDNTHLYIISQADTLPETNIAPENG